MKLFLIFTTFCWATVCLAVPQQFGFHTGFNCTGDALILQSKQPNLEFGAPIISRHKSFSVTGVWFGYRGINYTSTKEWFGGAEVTYCGNYASLETQSIRYLGPPDTTTHSLSLYEGDQYDRQEITITGPEFANLPFIPKILFSTGSTTWTFHTGKHFDGVATCYTPPTSNRWWHGDVLNYTKSVVGSVSRGCNL